MPEPFNEEHLSAYLDGELPPAERQAVEDWIKSDPAMQRALEEMRAVRDELQQFFQDQSFSLPNPAAFSEEAVRRAERAALRAGEASDEATAEQPAGGTAEPVAKAYTWRSNLPALFTAAAAAVVLAVLVVPQLFQTTTVAVAPERQPVEEPNDKGAGQTKGDGQSKGEGEIEELSSADAGETQPDPVTLDALPADGIVAEEHAPETFNKQQDNDRRAKKAPSDPQGDLHASPVETPEQPAPVAAKPSTAKPAPPVVSPMMAGDGGEKAAFGGAATTRSLPVRRGRVSYRVETLRQGNLADAVKLAIGEDVDLDQALASGDYELFMVTQHPGETTYTNSSRESKNPQNREAGDFKRRLEVASLSEKQLVQVAQQLIRQGESSEVRDRAKRTRLSSTPQDLPRPAPENAPQQTGAGVNLKSEKKPSDKNRFAAAELAANSVSPAVRKGASTLDPESDINRPVAQTDKKANGLADAGAGKAFQAAPANVPRAETIRQDAWDTTRISDDGMKLLIADVRNSSHLKLMKALEELGRNSVELKQIAAKRSAVAGDNAPEKLELNGVSAGQADRTQTKAPAPQEDADNDTPRSQDGAAALADSTNGPAAPFANPGDSPARPAAEARSEPAAEPVPSAPGLKQRRFTNAAKPGEQPLGKADAQQPQPLPADAPAGASEFRTPAAAMQQPAAAPKLPAPAAIPPAEKAKKEPQAEADDKSGSGDAEAKEVVEEAEAPAVTVPGGDNRRENRKEAEQSAPVRFYLLIRKR